MTQPVHRPLESIAGLAAPTSHAAHSQPASRATAPVNPATPANDDPEGSDWGLAPAKSGITRENKFILAVLLVLVAVFSFVVFRNFKTKQDAAKSAELAAKDGKHKDKGKGKDKTDPKSDEASTPALNDPSSADDPFAAGPTSHKAEELAEVDSKELAVDSFETSSGPSTHSKHQRGHRTSREESRLPEVATTEEHDAPPQLNASMEEAPAQATDLFDVPSEAVATIEEPPATTEIADATPRGRRGRGQKHQHPEVTEEVPTQINEPIESDPMQGIPTQVDPAQQPAEITGFDVSEPVATNEFAQTGGTASEPIRRRGTSPRSTDAAGVEMAQVPTQAEPTAPPHDHLTPTTPRTTAPRTTPRATTPRTAAVEPTPATPPIPTQPRVGSVPPPLDPNDPRLGGYREAELPVAGTTHRTASRPQAAPVSGQFDPHHQPLVANSGEYVVRPNDNYWRISRKVYGTARYFAALAKHNEASVPDPRHMKPGAMISTPAKDLLEQHYGNLLPVMQAARPVGAITHSPTAPKTYGFYVEADGQPAYRIGPTDNLSSISQKTLGRATRWDEIYDLNRERLSGPDALAVGSILKLPADASQTRVVGKPVQHR